MIYDDIHLIIQRLKLPEYKHLLLTYFATVDARETFCKQYMKCRELIAYSTELLNLINNEGIREDIESSVVTRFILTAPETITTMPREVEITRLVDSLTIMSAELVTQDAANKVIERAIDELNMWRDQGY